MKHIFIVNRFSLRERLDRTIVAYNMDASISLTQITTLAKHYNIDLNKKVKDLSKEELDLILYGS